MDPRIRRLVMSQPIPMRLVDKILSVEESVAMTPTRWEILKLMAQGMSNREIADARGISYEHARKQVNIIHQRFGIHGRQRRVRLVAYLYREGVL